MCKSPLEQDIENRNRELEVLNVLIKYLSNRDDEKDPSPEFKKQKDYGFINDVIVLLCPLHPLLVNYLSKCCNLKNDLSEYLRENCELQLGALADYNNERCLHNLREFLREKTAQYEAKPKEQ